MYGRGIAKPQSELKLVAEEVGVYQKAIQDMHMITKRLTSMVNSYINYIECSASYL